MAANIEACKTFVELGAKGVPVAWKLDEFSRDATGSVLFMEQGCWKDSDYAALEERGFHYAWAPLIALTDDKDASRQTAIGMYTLVVTERSTQKDIAIDFVKFLATDIPSQKAYALTTGQIPVTQEAFEAVEEYQNTTWLTFRSCIDSGVFRPSIPTYSAMKDEIGNLVYNLLGNTAGYTSEASIKQLLQNLNQKLQSNLNEAYE
jgi:maltose-binding protein MalE